MSIIEHEKNEIKSKIKIAITIPFTNSTGVLLRRGQ